MSKVCKFGGTSLASGESITNVAKIIKSDKERKFIVVSAPGKRFNDDIKVTDLLYTCANLSSKGKPIKDEFAKIRKRFIEIESELGVEAEISKHLDIVEKEIVSNGGNPDYAASRGEYLNAIIIAKKLEYTFVDAGDLIKFNEDGNFDAEYTNDQTTSLLAVVKNAVIPGFYGRLPNKDIKTFSRGGSDVSGSIIARAVGASVYENWTDVSGFLRADPRIVDSPKVIEILSYKELRELSYMGASVLHADAIFPVRSAGIPINIKNTFKPEDKGTMIVKAVEAKRERTITGIAGKKDYSIIFIEKSMMNNEVGFARRVLSVLERHGVTFEHMPTGIDTLSVIVPSEELHNKHDIICEKIRDAVSPDNLNIVGDIALIATVGHGMSRKIGTASRLINAVSKSGVNIKMIDQGSSELNIILAVCNSDYEVAVRGIYSEFFPQTPIRP